MNRAGGSLFCLLAMLSISHLASTVHIETHFGLSQSLVALEGKIRELVCQTTNKYKILARSITFQGESSKARL